MCGGVVVVMVAVVGVGGGGVGGGGHLRQEAARSLWLFLDCVDGFIAGMEGEQMVVNGIVITARSQDATY